MTKFVSLIPFDSEPPLARPRKTADLPATPEMKRFSDSSRCYLKVYLMARQVLLNHASGKIKHRVQVIHLRGENRMRKQKGFSLIELLIVVAIILIIAAI